MLHVIDWELSTRGRPCQDLGHLAAHLWMGAWVGAWGADLAGRFLTAALPHGSPTSTDVAIHFACEVLIRTVGPFHAGGPLGQLGTREPRFRRAVDVAVETLRTGRLPEAARVSRG